MAMSDTYMLLVDLIGYKISKSWWPSKPVDEHFLKGTLLVGLTEAEARDTKQYYSRTLNYKSLLDPSAQLFCKPKEVYLLTLLQKGLLFGIKSPFDRYQMSKCLQWAENLTVGDGVHVNIRGIPSSVKGIIRYIGNLPEENGTKFGVELLVSCCVINSEHSVELYQTFVIMHIHISDNQLIKTNLLWTISSQVLQN